MPEVTVAIDRREGLRIAYLAGVLAFAGLPLYLHLPRFSADLGLSLATIGFVLVGLRMLDFIQDPGLGWIAERLNRYRGTLAGLAFISVGVGFAFVFAGQPGLVGLVLWLALIFTGYSLGSILFYSQCAKIAGRGTTEGHLRLAGWRESGALAGIVMGAALPTLTGSYFVLGITTAALALAAILISKGFWTDLDTSSSPSFRDLANRSSFSLLAIAAVNALPVAVTSTLFLFFVESRLGLPNLAGVFLILFFVSAGLSAPLWSTMSARFGARLVLLPAMVLAIVAFAWTFALPTGSITGFAIISVVTGASLGADMVILPALFAATLARQGLPVSLGFGAWAFASKLALAIAAGVTLPVLQFYGFSPEGPNTTSALSALNYAYAIAPLLLKLPAVYLVFRLSDEVT